MDGTRHSLCSRRRCPGLARRSASLGGRAEGVLSTNERGGRPLTRVESAIFFGPGRYVTAIVRYRVALRDPETHLLSVRCELDPAASGSVVFRMPSWIRGSYLVRDFAKHVVSLVATRAGAPVAIERLDKRSFRVPAGSGPVAIAYRVFARDESVRKAWFDERRAFFNGSSLFYAVEGLTAAGQELTLEAPAGFGEDWRVATAMSPVETDPRGFGVYLAGDYEELIDHPFEIGPFARHDFDVDGIPHALVVAGRARFDAGRVTADLARLCQVERALFGHEPALAQYLFLTHMVSAGYGGLEHRASTALIGSRGDLPRPGDTPQSKEYRQFLGLCAHEYFHLWNVKRIAPERFAASDLAAEAYTEDLWHYEGVTSYYDDLVLRRAGLIDVPTYLDLLAETATRMQRAPAHRVQTLAEASFEAWIKFYQPDDNAPNQSTNYYFKGALVALCLDLTLRLESAITLDDVMRELWRRHGSTGVPVPERSLERIVGELSGLDLGPFFERALRSTDELPLVELLAAFGVRAERRAQTSPIDDGGRTASRNTSPWAGLKLKAGETVIVQVLSGSPAERAGLASGDQLVAVDGLRITASNWTRRLEGLTIGAAARLDYFRGDELLSTRFAPEAPPLDTWTFTLNELLDPSMEPILARRRAWLEG